MSICSFTPHGKTKKTAASMSYIPILTLLFLSSLCRSDDRLTPAKPLSPGDTLISAGGVFALGFFSPTSSNASLYLCIWYHNISEPTVVWTANRDNPVIAPSSPTLTFTSSSDLVLSDSQGRTPWAVKNNITGTGIAAVLLDTGNFVLQLPNGTFVWQSFDHPTDTMLPTMKILLSVGRLFAWRGLNDPSTGDFSLSFNTSSNLQLVIWNGIRPYSRILMLNGGSVFGGTFQNGTGDGSYYTYQVSDGSPYVRVTLDYMGVVRTLSWNHSSWTTISERPASTCDLYVWCGPFGYCSHVGDVPTCQCLDGFEPVGPGMNSSRGCRRTEALTCGKKSHFANLTWMKVPDKFVSVPNRSIDECASECSSNCSCTAYSYGNFSGGAMAGKSSCLVWAGELIDTGKYSDYGQILSVRLADFPVKENHKLLKIVLPIIACLLVLVCIALVMIPKYKASKRKKKELMLGYISSSNEAEGENGEFPVVSFEDITAATDNFSKSKQIGRGGFGKVYKGTLEAGNEVAIKRFSKDSEQGIVEFKNEIVVISKLQHKNLVRLLGCCIHGDERLLVYEYLPNKSLDAFLFDDTKQSVLGWTTRFKIIKGVARGLLYLQQDSRLKIIHRDLKAGNILLDSEMTPKISGFGMARIFGGSQEQANTARVVGTYGYMSPEYLMEGAFSVKSDIYSFGVLLLEIVSGLKVTSPQLITNFLGLTAYAWTLWQDGKTTELLHRSVIDSCPLHEVLRCIHVGLLCVQDHPNDRPLMSSVIFMLENESAELPAPKQPAYFAMRNDEAQEPRESTEMSVKCS